MKNSNTRDFLECINHQDADLIYRKWIYGAGFREKIRGLCGDLRERFFVVG